MKTRKKSRKVSTRRPANTRIPKKSIHNTDKKETETAQEVATPLFIIDKEWSAPKKSKGADEEL